MLWFARTQPFVGAWEVKAALVGKERIAMKPSAHRMSFSQNGKFRSVVKRGKRTFRAQGTWTWKKGLLRVKTRRQKYKFRVKLKGNRLLLQPTKEGLELGLLRP